MWSGTSAAFTLPMAKHRPKGARHGLDVLGVAEVGGEQVVSTDFRRAVDERHFVRSLPSGTVRALEVDHHPGAMRIPRQDVDPPRVPCALGTRNSVPMRRSPGG